MNWYIALCSLIAGFTIGLATFKGKELSKLREGQDNLIELLINRNVQQNEQLKEIFNQILMALVEKGMRQGG